MLKILSSERVIEYSVEFKAKVVRLTNELDIKAIEIAKLLNLHPMMIYRWRQENREGKFVEVPSRRISITKNSAPPKPNTDKTDEIKSLRKELEKVKKENDFLKKWDQYLKDKKKSDSDS